MDINSRMQQWDAAGRAIYAEDVVSALKPIKKSNTGLEFWQNVAKYLPADFKKSASFDVNARVDAWKKAEGSLSADVHTYLESTNPFKRTGALADLPMDVVFNLIDEILNELTRRESVTVEAPADAPASKPEPEKEEKEDDSAKDSEDSDDKSAEKKDDD